MKAESGSGFHLAYISVVLGVHNEAQNLPHRVENILSSDYPDDRVEIIVVSDGSTDGTTEIAAALAARHGNIRVLDLQPQQGRARAHNRAVKTARGDLLVFTDAETIFDHLFLRMIAEAFQDKEVGFASGALRFRNQDTGSVNPSVGFYWRFELWLREQESALGVYATGSGACCAVRRDLYNEVPPTGDIDFITPLDVIRQGRRCVHVPSALAYDILPGSARKEFHARVRMTAKNLYGTVHHWGWSGMVSHPLVTASLFSHKLGRWLTPYALILVFSMNSILLPEGGFFFWTFIAQLLFIALSIAGALDLPVPLARQAFAFTLANLAFLVGTIRALSGRVPRFYTPASQG